MKFSVPDAKIVDESTRWFAKFVTMAGQIQKYEKEKAEQEGPKEGTPAEGMSGLNIKDYNPGDFSVVQGGKKSKTKAKTKIKAKKRK